MGWGERPFIFRFLESWGAQIKFDFFSYLFLASEGGEGGRGAFSVSILRFHSILSAQPI